LGVVVSLLLGISLLQQHFVVDLLSVTPGIQFFFFFFFFFL
jgi:hypothetical protein